MLVLLLTYMSHTKLIHTNRKTHKQLSRVVDGVFSRLKCHFLTLPQSVIANNTVCTCLPPSKPLPNKCVRPSINFTRTWQRTKMPIVSTARTLSLISHLCQFSPLPWKRLFYTGQTELLQKITQL